MATRAKTKTVKSVKPEVLKGKRKVTKKINYLYIYASAVTIILVLSNAVMSIPFEIAGVKISLSVFTYPFIFLLLCSILKKYGFREVIEALIIAIVIQLFMFLLRWIIFAEIEINLFVASFASFTLSQFLCIFLYYVLMKNKLENILFIFLIFTLTILFDNVMYLVILKLFDNNAITIEMINISNIVKLLMSCIVSFIMSKVK